MGERIHIGRHIPPVLVLHTRAVTERLGKQSPVVIPVETMEQHEMIAVRQPVMNVIQKREPLRTDSTLALHRKLAVSQLIIHTGIEKLGSMQVILGITLQRRTVITVHRVTDGRKTQLQLIMVVSQVH